MEWKPKTEDEISREGLMEPGTYQAEVLEIEERDDKKGRPFWNVTLGVYGDDREGKVWDNISPYWMEFKFRHFFAAIGKIELYEKGVLPVGELGDLLRCRLSVEIGIEDAKDGYPAKNKVLDYVPAEVAAAVAKPVEAPKKDDDLPF
jgi:hypothetical protein